MVAISNPKPYPYQKVDGLEEIYIGLGAPHASFVFETAEKASKCFAAMKTFNEMLLTLDLKVGGSYGFSSNGLAYFVSAPNLSGKNWERVISYEPLPNEFGSVNVKTAKDLVHKVGKMMSLACPSAAVRDVPLHVVEEALPCSEMQVQDKTESSVKGNPNSWMISD